MTVPWSAAVATSIGSFPGTSPLETARIVAGELPDFVHVAELPDRGPGSDIIGRTGGLLAGVASGLALETTPQGWRFASASGRQMRLAQSFLGEDLDALEETAVDYAGPVKCQVAGPWTLAASIDRQGSGLRNGRHVGGAHGSRVRSPTLVTLSSALLLVLPLRTERGPGRHDRGLVPFGALTT